MIKIHLMENDRIEFQFISEPSDINFGGKVHGGAVMKWIDQTAYSCASNWAKHYCVTVYVGGIRFYKAIQIGAIVRIKAQIIYTGRTSMHIAVDVYSKDVLEDDFSKTTHCIIVFVAVDTSGNPIEIPKWRPQTTTEQRLMEYAIKLMQLRSDIDKEMTPFLHESST